MDRTNTGLPFQGLAKEIRERVTGKRQNATPASSRQSVAEWIVHRQLTEMALNRFEWRGLPDSASAEHIEMTLLHHGQALVALDAKTGRFMALQASPLGPANYQNEYGAFTGTGAGYSEEFRALPEVETADGEIVTRPANCVVIWNNSTRTPDTLVIQQYAERISELDTTVDINTLNSRRNKVVFANTDQEFAMANILSELAEGEPVIRMRNPGMSDQIGTLDLGVHPDSYDRLHVLRGRIFNEAMSLFGVDNTNQDKKERMVTEELGGNDDQIARMRSSALNARRKAATKITALMRANGMPSAHVTVDYFVDDDPANDPGMERDADGRVHADVE